MASLHSEQRGKRKLYRIQYRDGDKRRKSIRLGSLNRKAAEAIRSKVESLVSCRIAGQPLDADTSRWVANLGQDLADKLAGAGLIERRASATLGPFIDGYIENRREAEANTIRNWVNSRRKLTEFFGEERDLRTIRPGDADDWRQSLVDTEFSEATISKAVKHAKQFLRYAVRKRLAEENPFQELKAGGEENAERKQFINRGTIEKVLACCPDAEWSLIVALARFGGLRVPSEILALEWQHIDWAGGRFTVTSRKTKRQRKPWRVVPIFPELSPYLADAFDKAPEGSRYLITRYREANTNLRTQFSRILRKAGVNRWERLFHNLRASRQTELQSQFPSHVVCEWLGNSEAVAHKHYLTVNEEHFAQAIAGVGLTGGAGGGAKVVQQVVSQPSAGLCNQSQETKKASGVTAKMPVFPEAFASSQVPPRGVEPLSSD